MFCDYDFDGPGYYALPISRDNFFCRGPSDRDFYVEVPASPSSYQTARQSRESSSRLYDLLTYTPPPPKLTKKGTVAKRQPPPHQDESEAFYCAQLIHYGLKPLKTKEAAKKALLKAFVGGNRLEVPERILRLQKEMQEEWRVANEKAKVEYKEKRKRERDEEERRQLEKKERNAKLLEEVLGEAAATKSRKRKGVSEDAGTSKKTKATAKLDSSELKGKFNIVAPGLSDEWPDYGDSFTFTISPSLATGKHLWISFELGVVSGVMRSTGPPPATTNTPCDFTWRGTESGEGETTFGECNTASVVFLDDGKIKGSISGDLFQDVDFVGVKDKRKTSEMVKPKHVKEWKKAYRGINWRSYGRAEKMRWGGWVDEEGCEGVVDDSDTTDGGDKGNRDGSVDDEERWGEEGGGSDHDFYGSNLAF